MTADAAPEEPQSTDSTERAWGPRSNPERGSSYGVGAPETSRQIVGELHAELAPQLERIAWALLRDWELARDAVQDTFVLFSEKLDAIPETQRPGWLVRTVQFQAKNLRRKERRQPHRASDQYGAESSWGEQQPSGGTTGAGADPSRSMERLEQVERLQAAIDHLPIEQRQVVLARMAGQQGFAEIAANLKIPLGTALSRMRLALEKLKRSLADES